MYDIARAYFPTSRTHNDNDEEYERLLSEGWKPFAVTHESDGRDLVWFRVQVEEEGHGEG